MSCRIATTPLAWSRLSSAGCSATLTQRALPSGGCSIASRNAEPALPSPTRERFCCTRFLSSWAKSSARLAPASERSPRAASSPKAEFAYWMPPAASVSTTATRSVSKMRLKSSLAMAVARPRLLAAELADHAEQMVGRRMQRRLGAADRGKDAARDALAELHAPLVEGVDPPEHPLCEHLVLVDGEQRPQVEGVEHGQHVGRARAIARAGLVRLRSGEALH